MYNKNNNTIMERRGGRMAGRSGIERQALGLVCFIKGASISSNLTCSLISNSAERIRTLSPRRADGRQDPQDEVQAGVLQVLVSCLSVV